VFDNDNELFRSSDDQQLAAAHTTKLLFDGSHHCVSERLTEDPPHAIESIDFDHEDRNVTSSCQLVFRKDGDQGGLVRQPGHWVGQRQLAKSHFRPKLRSDVTRRDNDSADFGFSK
jgi:hypothetical protein